jgi:hypothetical protein
MKKIIALGIVLLLISGIVWLLSNLALLSCGQTCPSIYQAEFLPFSLAILGIITILFGRRQK